MALALSIFGVAFAALCVWLMVRIVNRKERWAKWTAVALAVMLVAYPLSYPWALSVLIHHGQSESAAMDQLADIYAPFGWAIYHCPDFIRNWYGIYVEWCLQFTGVPMK
jgi:hypothetical protein